MIETILVVMLPFYLVAAGGNQDRAKATIRVLIDAHNATTPIEMDLVGRIIGLSTGSMDNMRLSTTPNLPVTQVVRYRSHAVMLSRASDQTRKLLLTVQTSQQTRKAPGPSVAATPSAPVPSPVTAPTPAAAPKPTAVASRHLPVKTSMPASKPPDLEAMGRDANALLQGFSKHALHGPASIPAIADPATFAAAAATEAMAAMIRNTTR